MSLFNLFKKKEKGPAVIDKIWINQTAKENYCIKISNKLPKPTFIAWSTLTKNHFEKLLNEEHLLSVEVVFANDILPSRMRTRHPIFLEHRIERQKEIDLVKSWGLEEATFINSLDDPILLLFQSDRIKTLMERMGHNENEPIEHVMISRSIVRAQQKLEKEGLPENSSESVKKWLESVN